jgi:teichuronic acid biosynthesis glycosyltransferase TuaC
LGKGTLLIVNSGEIVNGEIRTSSFVLSQAKSLENEWTIIWGLTGSNSTNLGSFFRNVLRMRRLIKDNDVTVVHATYGSINAIIAMLAAGQKPFVVSFCGDDLLGTIQPGWSWRVRERIAKLLSIIAAVRANHIIAKSLNIKNTLPKSLQKKVSIVPNGVDTDFFKPLDRLECRIQLDLLLEKKYVLFNHSVGNNLLRKNRPLAEAAVVKVRAVMKDVELLVVGQVPHIQMLKFINASDLVLLTSFHEGSPNIIKEAMACNVPVVSVPCGDVRERIVSEQVGRICQYDADEIAKQMMEILSLSSRSNGRAYLLNQNLSAEQVKQEIEEIYHSVITANR